MRHSRFDVLLADKGSGERRLVLAPFKSVAEVGALDAWARRRAALGHLVHPVDGLDRGSSADHADRLGAWLGTERTSFYLRFEDDVRASDIAALLGTLRRGHVAILALPQAAVRRSALIRRLLAGTTRPTRANPPAVGVLRLGRARLDDRVFDNPGRHAATRPPPSPARRYQALAVDPQRTTAKVRATHRHRHAVAFLRTDPHACLLFLGARGTGKSTQLAALVPLLQALDPKQRPPLVVSGGALCGSTLATLLPGLHLEAWQSALRAPDRAVVIDEAASLPLAALSSILGRQARIVMASTVAGYEASGRAFEARFIARLPGLRPVHRIMRTTDRFRFDDDDVHRAVQRAFLLDALGAALPRSVAPTDTPANMADAADAAGGANVRIERVERPLGQIEGVARQTVTLLGATHYRTTLDELDPLLDGRLTVWLARAAGGQVVGLATVAREGELPTVLHDAVLSGKRRLPDQLLPQLLCRMAADSDALAARYARITRVAVAPQWRRRGIATRLVVAIRHSLPDEVAVGASFAEGADVEGLWRRAGFLPFHHGERINPRSGHRSMAVLTRGSPETDRVLSRARAVMQDNRNVRPDPTRDGELIARFARGERGMRDTLGPLNRQWRHWTGDPRADIRNAAVRLGLPRHVGSRGLERAVGNWARDLAPQVGPEMADDPGHESDSGSEDSDDFDDQETHDR